jgi:putative ABC transport system permease protein
VAGLPVYGAALFIRTFMAPRAVDPGYDVHNVMTMRMSLRGPRFATAASVAQVMRDGSERLAALPGIEVASAAIGLPLEGGFGLGFVIEGRPLDGPVHGGGGFAPIATSYFQAFKIPVIRGRAFTDQDNAAAPKVVIINQAMAKRYCANGDPLADRLTVGGGLGPRMGLVGHQIVGTAADSVRNMVIRQGMSVALLGVAIGAAAAFGPSRVIASFLFGVTARDALVFTVAPALLTAVAFVGVWLPARRAANVDPVVALREE